MEPRRVTPPETVIRRHRNHARIIPGVVRAFLLNAARASTVLGITDVITVMTIV
jgi:hypothetical protein